VAEDVTVIYTEVEPVAVDVRKVEIYVSRAAIRCRIAAVHHVFQNAIIQIVIRLKFMQGVLS
jgi:hypothetical protein